MRPLPGSPPNAAMLVCTHRSADCWSCNPKLSAAFSRAKLEVAKKPNTATRNTTQHHTTPHHMSPIMLLLCCWLLVLPGVVVTDRRVGS